MRGGRSGRRPGPRRRAAGLAPPPSLLHDSPVPSAEGREQSEPPFSPPPPFPRLGELSREARGSPPHPKPFSPPLPPSPPTLGRAGGTCARPARLPSARSQLPRACRGSAPARTARPPALGPPVQPRPARAPRPRPPPEGGREGGEGSPGSLLHLIPGRHAAQPPRGSRRPLGASPAPFHPETIPTPLAQGPDHPGGPPRGSAGGAAPPLPHPVPQPSAPARTCALHAAAASLRGAPSCPRGGQAHGEGEGAARDGVRAGNAVPRGPAVGRETERGARWGWGPKATLTGSTVAILDRSDRTTAPEGGREEKNEIQTGLAG